LEKTEQCRVFPVSWAWYENNPVATVKVTNEEPNAITDINLLFFMDSYMSQPWIFAALPRLDPGESVEVPITALFNEVLINLSNDVNANGIIQMRYRSLGARKESASAIQMPIHNRNALNWDDDRRAAAFVSPRDSSALHFARYVAGVVVGQGQTDTPLNVRNAAAMFEALRLYGINYVVDPASSYAALSEDASGLDSLNYPYQTIYYRSGDCDDLSILFCSLLEVIGIETAFITIPGHIYMAFEVGDNNWRMGNTDIIELDGKRWLPLEITVPDQGFVSAWRIGAREWRTGGPEASLYPIREAWKLYPAVTVPASGNRLPEMPDQAAIIRAMEVELQGKEERLLMMVYFVADRANMIERYRPAINKAGELLRANPAFHITLRGYAAPFGTAESCILVSEARTKYCKDYLVRSYGIAEGRISTENYGSEKAPESAGKDWESYRCVELILYKKEF
jgi:outer membrane protein OmpA-like peptidoglycan-associated protein